MISEVYSILCLGPNKLFKNFVGFWGRITQPRSILELVYLFLHDLLDIEWVKKFMIIHVRELDSKI